MIYPPSVLTKELIPYLFKILSKTPPSRRTSFHAFLFQMCSHSQPYQTITKPKEKLDEVTPLQSFEEQVQYLNQGVNKPSLILPEDDIDEF